MLISQDNGFQEAVGLVADADATATRLCAVLGYTVRHAGLVPAGALALMGLPAEAKAREVLIAQPNADRGNIRLVSLAGDTSGIMRDGAQAWDAGGIFDINIRALAGIEPLHHALGRAGFTAHAPVTTWDFGAVGVREVVESDGDGLCIALMERVHPPLTGYEHIVGPASWVFNSTQTVADFDGARAFYAEALGWQIVQESAWTHADGANCMGLPVGLAPQIPVRVAIFHPHGRMEGSVEIIAFGCAGLDFSHAAPPQRGWAALRFAVSDLHDFAARAKAGGCQVSDPQTFGWAPHGPVQAIAAVTPWGARLEALRLL